MIPDPYRGVSGPDPGPVDGVLAVLDGLLRHATLIVEGCGHIGDGLIYAAAGDSNVIFAPPGTMWRKIITGCRKR